MRISEKLRSPLGTLTGAAIVSAFDALLHVVIDMVEPPRIAGNLAGIAAFAVVSLGLRTRPRSAAVVTGVAAGVVAGLNLAWIVVGGALPAPAALLILGALGLLLASVWLYLGEAVEPDTGSGRSKLWLGGIGVAALLATLGTFLFGFLGAAARQLHDDQLVDADIWADELVILSAGMGFDNVIGVPDSEFATVREAGGSFYANPDCANADGPLVTTVESGGLSLVSRGFTDFDDGLPVVTSWPVLTSTVHPEDFLVTLNDGSQVTPNAITMTPNWELNERNTMVLFGDFGNRGIGDEPDKLFPVRMEFVDDGTPLTFVGPNGLTESGVGLTWETDTSPYESGPFLVGAKLNRIGDEATGEGGVTLLEAQFLPNDEFALYGGGDFRIRILTTGGFSPDGLTGVTPDQFADFFRIHATGPEGETVLLTEADVEYDLAGGTLRVVGLSDLGLPAGGDVTYDDCYAEDSDNYIDIILEGDEAAARGLRFLEIPTADDDGYLSFFNPGGPGPEPFDDVRYSAPGPPDLEPIINALDDPMRVSWPE